MKVKNQSPMMDPEAEFYAMLLEMDPEVKIIPTVCGKAKKFICSDGSIGVTVGRGLDFEVLKEGDFVIIDPPKK